MVLRIACYALVCHDKKIYVSTDDLNKWSCFVCDGIQVLSLNEEVLQNIQLIQRPRRFCVDNDGKIPFNCITPKNINVCQINVPKAPDCFVCDDEGNILLSSGNEVLVVKSDGTENKILIKEDNFFSKTEEQNNKIAFSYNKSNNTLLCFMAELRSENSAAQSASFPKSQNPYFCHVNSTWKRFILDMLYILLKHFLPNK